MATELALDLGTGDLIISPNGDFDIRSGLDSINQRIRVRLKIAQGTWPLDPTGGSLGSRLREAFRLPTWRATTEVPLIVREALAPMTEIFLRDVTCQVNDESSDKVDVSLAYSMVEDDGNTNDVVFNTTVTV